jgi:hypothetical protein
MKITSISPTTLQLYEDCPNCFLLKVNLVKQQPSLPMMFGSKVHNAIEQYHRHETTEFDEDVQEYLDEYMSVYDCAFDVLEERMEVPLLDTDIVMPFKMDLIKDGWIMEHKTSSTRYTEDQIAKHKQTSAYSYAFRQIYGEEEKGIRFNVFCTKVKKNRLECMDTFRTEEDLAYWEQWVRDILRNIEEDKFDPKPGLWHLYSICPFYRA